ncbi:MAG: type II toxin-antitoxin system RelE/ParE family toxin [Gemmatimonadales bacterium]
MTLARWTPQALEDLEAIRAYVSRDSVQYAAVLVERLFTAVDRLEVFPDSGRIVPEFQRRDLREVILGSYRIVYRLSADRAVILTVFHGARLFPKTVEGAL